MTTGRIVITGDLLRPGAGGTAASQTSNVAWLHALLAPLIVEATGKVPELIASDDQSIGYRSSWVAAAEAPSDEAWARLSTAAPPALTAAWAERLADAVVIGFEMPPSLKAAISRCGGRWVDVVIHPVRFMDDIFLGFATHDQEMNDALAAAAMPERFAFRAAGAISAFAKRARWVQEGERPFTLYAAQVAVDRSMIENGRLLDTDDISTRIDATLTGRGLVLYKDHPYERTDPVFAAVARAACEVRRTQRNAYGLLADPALEQIVSASSGLGVEARYFGKPVRYLLGPSTPVRWKGDTDGKGFWSIYDAFLAPDFWRALLSPTMSVTAMDNDEPMHRPDLLRLTLRSYWGFKDVLADPFQDLLVPAEGRLALGCRKAAVLLRKTRLMPAVRMVSDRLLSGRAR